MKDGKRRMLSKGKKASKSGKKRHKIKLSEELIALHQYVSKLGPATQVEDIVQITLDGMESA